MNFYDATYKNSWALCIGINSYKNVSPLEFAINDATEVARVLIEEFSFPEENVIVLTDREATKVNILKKYMEFSEKTEPNDRIILYFAGHGHTVTGNRGEVGYLIPYDADQGDLSSFIRWDELTKNAELIPAKHLLFILDACFSGIAITRSLSAGTMRFMEDMLQRYSRQALAAGKANQPVSDGNGSMPNHSVFTCHLLKGLNGEASTKSGLLTANGLMQYVYQKVANDSNSYQTPHYGFIDGDGDLILNFPKDYKYNEREQETTLFEIPNIVENSLTSKEIFLQRVKKYLAEEKYRIKLEDLIIAEIKKALCELNKANFPRSDGKITEEFMKLTIKKFEDVLSNLQAILLLVSNWGNDTQKGSLLKIFSRLCTHIMDEKSTFLWSSIIWYPVIWLLYSLGISLLTKGDYKTLYNVISMETVPYRIDQGDNSLLFSYSYAYSQILQGNLIKVIKEHERHFTPLSEYLFKNMQFNLEDILFIGSDYEFYFDKYEILISMEIAYRHNKYYDRCWASVGRFGWKHAHRGNNSDVMKFIESGRSKGKDWEPVKAGFFDSKPENFSATSDKFVEYLRNLNWY